MNISSMVKKSVRALKAYDPALFKGKYKLDANENSFEIPEGIRKSIISKLKKLPFNRYPDATARELKKVLAKKYKVLPENIFAGNGSDEIIYYMIQAFCEKGDAIVVPKPSFEMFRVIGTACDARVIESSLDENFDINDAEIIKKARNKRAKFIFLAYPNNPTGNCFSFDRVMNVIKKAKCFVVLDEAYSEFCGKSFLPYMKRYKNLLVMHTFSKAYSMAGLRVGYLIAPAKVAEILNRVRLPYNINSISQYIAVEALKYEKELKKSWKIIIEQRDWMYRELSKKYFVIKSDANFLCLKLDKPEMVKKSFQKKGVSIRMFASGPMKGYARITVGKPLENKLVMDILLRGVK
jgi:histidinol-phosphate aminotransferase